MNLRSLNTSLIYIRILVACCWAFSAAAAVEGAIGNGQSLSAQQLLDCVPESQGSGCIGGAMEYAFTYIMQNQGLSSEKYYPYELEEKMCRLGDNVARIGGCVRIYMNNEEALMESVVA